MNYNQYGGDRPILRERNNNLEKFATTYVNALSKDNKEQRKKVVKIEDFDPVIRTENINSIGQLLNMKASKLFQNVFQFRPNGKLILSDKSSIKIDNARQLWEQSSPQTQCKNVIKKFDIKTTNCYICGLPIKEEDSTKTTTDCEHILPIAHAVVLLDLYKGSEKDVVSNLMKMEYEWSHTCCNMIKSETSFIRFNEGKEKKNQPPFEFNDQGIITKKAAGIGEGVLVPISKELEKSIYDCSIQNVFDCQIVERGGQCHTFDNNLDPRLCSPENVKVAKIKKEVPVETSDTEQEEEVVDESGDQGASKVLRVGRLYKCNCSKEFITKGNYERHVNAGSCLGCSGKREMTIVDHLKRNFFQSYYISFLQVIYQKSNFCLITSSIQVSMILVSLHTNLLKCCGRVPN